MSNEYEVELDKQNLPITADASLGLKVTSDLWDVLTSGQPFSEEVASGDRALIETEVRVPESNAFSFDGPRRFGFSVKGGTGARLDLIWPDEEPDVLAIRGLQASPDQLYLLFETAGSAQLEADIQDVFPSSPASASAGINAGGGMTYRYAAPFPASRSANDILQEFFEGLKIPQQIARADDLPQPGGMVELGYRGHLAFDFDAGWGYDTRKLRSFDFGALDVETEFDVSAKTALTFDCGVEGDYRIEVRRDGDRDQWARVCVRKGRKNALDAALNVDVRVTTTTDGLPEKAPAFLASVTGVTIPDQVREMRKLLEEPDQFLSRLEEETNALTKKGIDTLFEKWYPNEEIENHLQPFLADLNGVLNRYDELAGEKGRLVSVLSAYTVQELEGTLQTLDEAQDRSDLNERAEPIVKRVLTSVAGENYARLVAGETDFSERKKLVRERLEKLLEESGDKVLDLFGLADDLFDVDSLVSTLQTYDSPTELREQAKAHVVDFAERLSGHAFEELEDQEELDTAFHRLNTVVDRLDAVSSAAYEKLTGALNDNHRVALARTYRRTETDQALLDVRINLGHPDGQELMESVVHGDLRGAGRLSTAEYAELIGGRFTEVIETENTVTLSLPFVGTYRNARELVLNHEERFQREGGELFHIYDLGASETEITERNKESTKMTFFANLLAKKRVPADDADTGATTNGVDRTAADFVQKMSMRYDFRVHDPNTHRDELIDYLRLAEYLNLLPPEMQPEEYVNALASELGIGEDQSFEDMTLNYDVRYDPATLLRLFEELDRETYEQALRRIFRRFAAGRYLRVHERSNGSGDHGVQVPTMHRRVGQALLSDDAYEAYNSGTLAAEIPGDDAEHLVETLFQIEDEFIDALERINEVINSERSSDDLPKAFDELIQMRDDLEDMLTVDEDDRLVNPFFALIDRILVYRLEVMEGKRMTSAEWNIKRHGESIHLPLMA